ncbi:MAG: ribonuclease P protein component [Acidobacteriota bacterium]
MFPKTARILRSAEFRNIYDNGLRLPGPLFAAFLLQRPAEAGESGTRLGITVPRAVGGSVDRNRIRRRIREAFRKRGDKTGNWDVVLNPRRTVLKATCMEIERALDKVMDRCKR